jgi:hypothetical protein
MMLHAVETIEARRDADEVHGEITRELYTINSLVRSIIDSDRAQEDGPGSAMEPGDREFVCRLVIERTERAEGLANELKGLC